MTQRPVRTVYLVDDNAEFRASAQWWLSGAGYRVHDFGDARAALDALDRLAAEHPEDLHRACLLLDVRMPGLSGLDLHDRLADRGLTLRPELGAEPSAAPPTVPPLPIVYMTGHGDVTLAVAAMQKGAVTMLEKPFADDALEQALARAFAMAESAWARQQVASLFAANGDVWLPPTPPAPPPPDPAERGRLEYQRRLESLSPRQRQVLQGIVAGKLSKQIAWEIGLSCKTVEFHRKCLMERMQARNAMHLLRMAVSRTVDVAEALVA